MTNSTLIQVILFTIFSSVAIHAGELSEEFFRNISLGKTYFAQEAIDI